MRLSQIKKLSQQNNALRSSTQSVTAVTGKHYATYDESLLTRSLPVSIRSALSPYKQRIHHARSCGGTTSIQPSSPPKRFSIADQGNQLIEKHKAKVVVLRNMDALVRLSVHREEDLIFMEMVRDSANNQQDPNKGLFEDDKSVMVNFMKLYFRERWRTQKETALIDSLISTVPAHFPQHEDFNWTLDSNDAKMDYGDDKKNNLRERLSVVRKRFFQMVFASEEDNDDVNDDQYEIHIGRARGTQTNKRGTTFSLIHILDYVYYSRIYFIECLSNTFSRLYKVKDTKTGKISYLYLSDDPRPMSSSVTFERMNITKSGPAEVTSDASTNTRDESRSFIHLLQNEANELKEKIHLQRTKHATKPSVSSEVARTLARRKSIDVTDIPPPCRATSPERLRRPTSGERPARTTAAHMRQRRNAPIFTPNPADAVSSSSSNDLRLFRRSKDSTNARQYQQEDLLATLREKLAAQKIQSFIRKRLYIRRTWRDYRHRCEAERVQDKLWMINYSHQVAAQKLCFVELKRRADAGKPEDKQMLHEWLAAVVIQSAVRRWIARSFVKRKWDAITTIQRTMRGHHVRTKIVREMREWKANREKRELKKLWQRRREEFNLIRAAEKSILMNYVIVQQESKRVDREIEKEHKMFKESFDEWDKKMTKNVLKKPLPEEWVTQFDFNDEQSAKVLYLNVQTGQVQEENPNMTMVEHIRKREYKKGMEALAARITVLHQYKETLCQREQLHREALTQQIEVARRDFGSHVR